MTTEQLKPCPFCGGHAQTDFIEGTSYIIECLRISCCARTDTHDSPEEAIAAWNRRTPVEQSAQTAEPVAWMLEFDSDDENAVTVDPKVVEMWRTQHDNPYDVTPLYTHPAKTEIQTSATTPEIELMDRIIHDITGDEGEGTCFDYMRSALKELMHLRAQTEQPSLSDHQLKYVQECIERAKLLPVWDNVPHSLHTELDNIFRGVALLSAQRQKVPAPELAVNRNSVPISFVLDERAEDEYVIERLSTILAGVAIALKGEELPLHLHSYHDLAELAKAKMLEIDLLNHQIAELSAAQRQDSDKDAERYRKAIAYEDNAGLLYCAVMNHCPDKAAIDAEFDAEAIDVGAIANGAPK